MTIVPRLFLSYSWSSPEHEAWVDRLATELAENGVDVVYDKWDLREGHESTAFMERAVADSTISKVVMVCDRAYKEKADGRAGGVGAEAQIISTKLYASKGQDKFLAVVAEKDEADEPPLPAYYASRIYIDLSEPDRYGERFDQLLRWVFGKPLNVRPPLGKPPAFLTEPDDALSLGTSVLARRASEALRHGRTNARGALDEYLATFAERLGRLRLTDGDPPTDEAVEQAIQSTGSARLELLEVLGTFVRYGDAQSLGPVLHRFLESLLAHLEAPVDAVLWSPERADHLKFFAYEAFLTTLALLLRERRLDAGLHLFAESYVVLAPRRGHAVARPYTVFCSRIDSLVRLSQRPGKRCASLQARLLKERADGSAVAFEQVMQADFVCFLRARLNSAHVGSWYPQALLYAQGIMYGPFELFARSASRSHFEKLLSLLGVDDAAEGKQRLDAIVADRPNLPQWDYEPLEVATLLGSDRLGSLP